jgi:hypothetical protein
LKLTAAEKHAVFRDNPRDVPNAAQASGASFSSASRGYVTGREGLSKIHVTRTAGHDFTPAPPARCAGGTVRAFPLPANSAIMALIGLNPLLTAAFRQRAPAFRILVDYLARQALGF